MRPLEAIESEWWEDCTEEERRGYGAQDAQEKRKQACSLELRSATQRGFFRACRLAVSNRDAGALQAWLNEADTRKQPILRSGGPDLYPAFRSHLLCAVVACRAKALCREDSNPWDAATLLLKATWEALDLPSATPDFDSLASDLLTPHWPTSPVNAPDLADRAFRLLAQPQDVAPDHRPSPGFLRDLTHELFSEEHELKPQDGIACGNVRPSEREERLPALLVDVTEDEGVVAILRLELMPEGTGALFPIPALAFRPTDDFRQAAENARKYLTGQGHWKESQDVRWRLERQRRQPISALSGPSLGAAFALGMEKLFAGE
jgi:hypothetical protein